MIKDYKGDVIEVGTIVAFNLSGRVRIGEVVKIRKTKYSNKPGDVRLLHGKDKQSEANGWVSKMKDLRDCAVISEKVTNLA